MTSSDFADPTLRRGVALSSRTRWVTPCAEALLQRSMRAVGAFAWTVHSSPVVPVEEAFLRAAARATHAHC